MPRKKETIVDAVAETKAVEAKSPTKQTTWIGQLENQTLGG